MRKISLGLLLIALTTLMVELSLVRVFDVIWYSNMAYMVITLVMFCFGLSGVFMSLFPIKDKTKVNSILTILAIAFGISTILIFPATNFLHINFDHFYFIPFRTSIKLLLLYFFISLPFFIAGLILTVLFSNFSEKIQSLYFWDLFGAAIGCLILIPLLPTIGPGGIVIIGGGVGFIAAALFTRHATFAKVLAVIGCLIFLTPFTKSFMTEGLVHKYFEFEHHIVKRGLKADIEKGWLEASYWDPISKIDIVNQPRGNSSWKHIAYDGGSQSTFIYPFDGDFEKLKESLPGSTPQNFGSQAVFLSHLLKEGTDAEVLIIGAAGGQETKAALTYGAGHVDAVELVGFVVHAGKNLYNDFNGNILNHPNVDVHVDEGRSFLRSANKKYDIIQMFSNHTSSSIGAGTGAMATTYLQTSDAYKEYFSHLKDDGILQINHHVYPRMVVTAAKAWKEMGRDNFRQHVLVFSHKGAADYLPTFLVRMTPWTKEEVDMLRTWFWGSIKLVEDPYNPDESMLSDDFYEGELSKETLALAKYRMTPCTDNHPYFNFFKKEWEHYTRGYPENYMDYATAALLSSQNIYRAGDGTIKMRLIPTDVVHLFITSAASLVFACVFIFIPLFFAKTGKEKWKYKFHSLGYFSCLGAGFIIIELVLIQIFMKLIGFPLYTYSSVVFALLVAAGTGSYVSGKMKISPTRMWQVPFIGTLLSIALILFVHQPYFQYFLTYPVLIRVLAAIALLFPSGFFMGMCFPLGIFTIREQPTGAVAWAWGMNGLFTVIGGILSVLISIYLGFKITLMVGMLIYIVAFVLYSQMKKVSPASVSGN